MTFPIFATSPLPYAVVGTLLLAGCWRFLPRWSRITGVGVLAILVALMTPAGANALAAWVESRAPSANACAPPTPHTIVVLGGGGIRAPRSADDYGALRHDSLERVFAGVGLWRRIPGAHMVMSGGGQQPLPEAVVMSNLAMRMGVPATAITIEDESRTTWENARNVSRLEPPTPQRIWLVTSPMHLPRALGAFRAWGFEPCAWPSGPRDTTRHFRADDLVPQGTAARTSAIALHEWIGGMRYAMLERAHAKQATPSATHPPSGTKGD